MPWCKSFIPLLPTKPNHIHSHLQYTIPPAVALTFCYHPLSTSLGVYKILFLIAVGAQAVQESALAYRAQIAVISTTPWDSYLIHTRIWTYPPNAIIGPTLFRIPAEEVFFFVIQTYNTSLLYLLLSKPIFHPIYLQGQKLLNDGRRIGLRRWIGISAIIACIFIGIGMIKNGGRGLYMGLILVWAGPFVLLLWYYQDFPSLYLEF